MLLCRKSDLTGRTHVMDIPALDPEKAGAYYRGEFRGHLTQNLFPELTADEREFVMTGITPAEWNELFGAPA